MDKQDEQDCKNNSPHIPSLPSQALSGGEVADLPVGRQEAGAVDLPRN